MNSWKDWLIIILIDYAVLITPLSDSAAEMR